MSEQRKHGHGANVPGPLASPEEWIARRVVTLFRVLREARIQAWRRAFEQGKAGQLADRIVPRRATPDALADDLAHVLMLGGFEEWEAWRKQQLQNAWARRKKARAGE